jgi:hypothetical protein
MMKLNDILDAVEYVMRLEQELKEKGAAIEAATTFADRGVARRAAEEHRALILKHRAFLPDPDTLGSNASLIRMVASYRLNRAIVADAVTKAEAAIVEAEETAKKSAWKRVGVREESKEVVAARAALASAIAAQEEHEEGGVDLLDCWERTVQRERDQEEIAAWVARGYEGPRPECIQQNEAALQEEIEEECDVIPIRGRRPYIFVS